jgi:hypothetical protein
VRIEDTVPRLTAYLAGYGFLLNLALFILFIDSIGKTLRPSSAVRAVALAGRDVIRGVYPTRLDEESVLLLPLKAMSNGLPRIVTSDVDGAVLAFDLKGLVALAKRSNCLVLHNEAEERLKITRWPGSCSGKRMETGG